MKRKTLAGSMAIFLNICFISSAAVAIFMATRRISIISGSGSMYMMVVSSVPGLAAIGICSINRIPLESLGLKLNLRKNIRFYLLGWLMPVVLAAAGAILYFLAYPGNFDSGMKLMTETLVSQGVSRRNVTLLFTLQLMGGLFIAPIANLIPCGMEELGFRGFLLPAISRRIPSAQWSVIISSLLWGLWYVPLAAIGYRYGAVSLENSWKAMGFVVLFSLMTGCILSWLRLKTNSILPGVLFRSVLNGFATAAAWFIAGPYDMFIGPAVWGILGGIPLLVCGALCISMCKGKTTFESAAGEQRE